jgi:ribonucleoside-diphosphate reductase alpha chain
MQIIESGSFSEAVWNDKYRFNDESLDGTFQRVAKAIAECEEESDYWAGIFHEAMADFEWLPAGRILAGAGTGRDVTLVNCFVTGSINDSMAGIMDALKDASLTLKAGGGIGMDFSTLRPRNAVVRGVDSVSSGAVSFMKLWDSMCGTIMSAGARRGAMMAVLRIDHPDVEEFIAAKHTAGVLTNFNFSVAVTDDFMLAVESDSDFNLVFDGKIYKTVKARELWDTLMRSTYEHSEPGVIFIDRVNEKNPLRSSETIATSNPCGEQLLPPHGACVLGSINLAALIIAPFTANARINTARLNETARIGTRFLDNVVSVSNYPLTEQYLESQSKRRIGIGITGLADALIMLGIRYGSDQAQNFVGTVMDIIHSEALAESVRLGATKGHYPAWKPEHGPRRRNSHLLSIAPTGTISAFAGYVSSGIEPVFAYDGQRRVLNNDGTFRIVDVVDYAERINAGSPKDPATWVTADDVSPSEHVAMVAAAQKHIDSAVSKTINCPASISFDEFRTIYDEAYDKGAKGCTTYRPSPSRGAVLLKKGDQSEPSTQPVTNVVHLTAPTERPDELTGTTYKVKPAGAEHALYITICDLDEGSHKRPFEMFIASKMVDGMPWMMALSRMVSAVFRRGGDVSFVAEELRAIHDPNGGYWDNGQYTPSLVAAIGDVIEKHLQNRGSVNIPIADAGSDAETILVVGKVCPKCQRGRLVKREGCENCTSCDYTKC